MLVPPLDFSEETLERLLRKEWWLNHGCPPGTAYGDDGEMSCSCGIDAKRMTMPDLAAAVAKRRIERGSVAWEEFKSRG